LVLKALFCTILLGKNMRNSAWAGLAIGAEIGGDALAKGGFKFHLRPARKKWRLREDSNPQPAD
jgi:hypothetical protein